MERRTRTRIHSSPAYDTPRARRRDAHRRGAPRARCRSSPEEQDAAAAMYNHLVTPSGTKIAHRAETSRGTPRSTRRGRGRVLDRLARGQSSVQRRTARRDRSTRSSTTCSPTPCWHGGRSARPTVAWRRSGGRERGATAVCSPSPADARGGRRRPGRRTCLCALTARSPGTQRREAEASSREAEANDLAALAEATVPTSWNGASRLPSRRARARIRPRWRTLRSALRALRPVSRRRWRPDRQAQLQPEQAPPAAAPDRGAEDIVRLYASDGSRLVGRRTGIDVSFGPNGRRLVTAGRSAVVSDMRTGRRLLVLGHPEGVLSARFSPDFSLIATTSPDRQVRLWDARTGRLNHALPASDPETVSSQAAFDRSSRLLVTWGGGPAALIYDVRTGSPTARLLHRGRITVARFAPTSNVLMTGGLDRVARLWDGATGDQLRVFQAMSVAFSTWHSAIPAG